MSCTLSGTFLAPDGSPAALGTLILTLNSNAVEAGAGWIVPQRVSVALNSSGAIPAATTIIGNDSLTPSGTSYAVKVVTAGGTYYDLGNFSITGGTFNFNTATPTGGGVTYPFAVVQTPSSPQNVTGEPLNLVDAPLNLDSNSPLTISALLTAGTVDAAAINSPAISASQINSVLYVGGSITEWGGGDIGSQINAAYAALPPTGGTIFVVPQANGAPYSYSTPIVFGTQAKYVRLLAAAPASQGGSLESGTLGGSTLVFTPTTGTNFALTFVDNQSGGSAVYHGTFASGGSNALAGKTFQIYGFTNMANNGFYVCTASSTTSVTLANGFAASETHSATAVQMVTAVTFSNDGTPGSTNFDGFAIANSIEDLCIANRTTGLVTCMNYGTSSGSAAIGLDNSGAGRLMTKNLRIIGFGVGRQCVSPIEWGGKDFDMSLSRNGVGMLFYNGMENYAWIGGTALGNGIGVQFTGQGSDASFNQVSFDSNGSIAGGTTATGLFGYGVVGHQGGMAMTFVGCHFENLISGDPSGAAPPTFVQNLNGPISIHGGIASNDNTSSQPVGYTAPFWFSAGGTYAGAALSVYGLALVGNNQPSSMIFQANGGGGFLSGTTGAPAPTFTALFGGTGAGKVTNYYTQGTIQANNVLGVANSYIVLANGTPVTVGTNVTRGLFLLSNNTNGGTALVLVDPSQSPSIVIVSQSIAGQFQVGAPSAGIHVGLTTTSTPFLLQATGTSTSAGQQLGWFEIALLQA